MSKTKALSKTVVTIIVTLLMFSMILAAIPMASAALTTSLSPSIGPVGTKPTVSGSGASVGGLVEVYWENLGGAKLNSTYALGDGSYSCLATVPDAVNGTHWVVVRDVSTGATAGAPFQVNSSITLGSTSGIPGDSVAVTGSGFAATSNMTLLFTNATYSRNVTPALMNSSATGNFSATITVPTDAAYGPYTVNATDASGNNATKPFTVGAAITIAPTSGPTGTPVTITGRGFYHAVQNVVIIMNQTTTFTLGANTTTIKTGTDGTFAGTFIVPSISKAPATVNATDGTYSALATFTVTGVTSLTASPTSAPPGGTITVTGTNFTAIAGTTVTVSFGAFPYTFTTNSSGGFSGPLTTPNLPDGTYSIVAVDANGLNATISYTLKIILLSISPSIGPTGTLVTVTGYGFTINNHVNVTLGGYLVNSSVLVASSPVTATFLVPTMATGTYSVIVTEAETGLTGSTSFTVNATSSLTVSPAIAPVNLANVALTVRYFAAGATVSFFIQNSTYSAALSVTNGVNPTNASGFANATFTVPSLALGAYTIVANETTFGKFNATTSFTVATATFVVSTGASTYSQGGTVTFNVYSAFAIDMTINIFDPAGNVGTLNIVTGDFVPSGGLYVIPVSSSHNKLTLASDAVTGTWTWNTTVSGVTKSGSFTVIAPATVSDLSTAIAAIEAKLDQYGSFWNFTNTWFTTISSKLGIFTGADTVASLLYNIKNMTDTINWADITYIKAHMEAFQAGAYSTSAPTLLAPVNLAKGSKVTLTVQATDDSRAGFVVDVHIYANGAWQTLSFSVPGIKNSSCAATVEFTTGTDGRFYFGVTGATFAAYIYSAESTP